MDTYSDRPPLLDYAYMRYPQQFRNVSSDEPTRPCPLRAVHGEVKMLHAGEGPHACVWYWQRGSTVRLLHPLPPLTGDLALLDAILSESRA